MSVWANVDYPDVPTVRVALDEIPERPGIYFFWEGDDVAYVGKSRNLRRRAKAGHDKLQPGDQISFLVFDLEELDFAECYYIGIVKPWRNFGGRTTQWEVA